MESHTPAKLSILSFGAGAIGTYIGGSLALHGHSVTFLERPEVAAGLRQRGLRLKLGDQEHLIEKPLLASTLEVALGQGPFDAAIFALKSFDTAAMIRSLLPYQAELPPILCLQNGVENELLLADALGAEKVIPGTVTSAVGRQAAGDIVLERLRGMGIAAAHPISATLAQACTQAGLNARLYPSAAAMKWSKMLTNLLANATSAILDMTPAEIFSHPGLYRLEIEQLRETLRVMSAQNIAVVDLPGTPVRLLAFAVRRLPTGLSRPLLRNAVQGGRGAKMPSFYIDLKSGRGQTEVDALNGAVRRNGEKLGVPTPVNRLLGETLTALASGELPTVDYARNPEKLLKSLKKR
jgi:2-dehydropantoate 2-reductase